MKTTNPVESMYLDYVNNFITSTAFAKYYGISNELAGMIIKEGNKLYKEDK